MFTRFLRVRFVAMFALALIMAAGAYGFAASNTVPASYAGDGSNPVSGFVITNVHYNLNTSNPANVDSVQFDITGPAVPSGGTVYAKVSGVWSSACTVVGSTWTCALSGATALLATSLQVVAAQ